MELRYAYYLNGEDDKTTISVGATCDEGVTVSKEASGIVVLFFVLGVK